MIERESEEKEGCRCRSFKERRRVGVSSGLMVIREGRAFGLQGYAQGKAMIKEACKMRRLLYKVCFPYGGGVLEYFIRPCRWNYNYRS